MAPWPSSLVDGTMSLLSRFVRVVRPPRFLIRVPLSERDWRVPLKRELGVQWRSDPSHEIEYTPASFAEKMAAARLKVAHPEVRRDELWAEVVPDGSSSPCPSAELPFGPER
jgi:hypothetical protein